MKGSLTDLVVGVGSSHGDDAAGFRLVDLIQAASLPGVRCLQVQEPLDIASCIGRCRRLCVIDACHSAQPLGTLTRLEWPVSRRQWPSHASTHALGLIDALQLAQNLGKLPKQTVLYGIEIGDAPPAAELSAALAARLPQIAKQIMDDMKVKCAEELD